MLVSVFSVVTLAAATVVAAPQKGYDYQQESAPSLGEPLRAVEATLQEQVVLPDSSNLVNDEDHHHHDHHDHVGLDWLRDSVPGEPGVDYPIFGQVPKTSFRCRGRQPGYYADIETRCQVFHICNVRGGQAFLCPNGTIFDQQHFTCKWWFTVNCEDSEGFFDLNNNIGSAAETRETQVVREDFGQKTEQPQETQQVQQIEQVQPEIHQVQEGQTVQETQKEEHPILLPDQIPTRVHQFIQPVPQESGTIPVQQPQEVLISQVPQEENIIHNVLEISTGAIGAEIEDSTIRQVINQLIPDQKDTQNTPSTSQEEQNELDVAFEKPTACGQGSADCVAKPSGGVSQLYDGPTLNTGESVSVHNLPEEAHATGGIAEEENLIVPGISQVDNENKAIEQDHQARDNEVKNEVASPELSAAPRYDDTPETVFHISQVGTSVQEEKMHPIQENQLQENDDQLIAQGLFPVQTEEQQAPTQGEQVLDEEQGKEQIFTQEEQVPSLHDDSDQVKIQFPVQIEEQTTQTVTIEEESPVQLEEQGENQLSIQEEQQLYSQEGEYHAKVQEYVPLQDEFLASTVEVRTGNEQIHPLQLRIRIPMQPEEGSLQGEGHFAVNDEEGSAIQEEELTTPTVPLLDEEQFVANFEEQFPTLEEEEASHVQLHAGEQIPFYNEEHIPAYGHEQTFTHTEEFSTIGEEHFPVHAIEVLPVSDGEEHFSVTTVFPEQLDDEPTGFPVLGEDLPAQEEEIHGYGTETSDFPHIPPTKVPSTFIIEIPSEVFEAPAEAATQGTFGVAQTDLPTDFVGEQEISNQSEVVQKEYTEDFNQEGVTSLYGLQEKDETTASPVDLEHGQVPEAVQPLCNSISCPTKGQDYSYGIAVGEFSPQTPPFIQDLSGENPQFDNTQVQDTTGLVEETDYSSESSEEVYGDSDIQTTTVAPEDTEHNEVFQIDIRHESPVTLSVEGDFQQPEVNIIHPQIPQLYEAPETASVTEEAVTAFETGTEIVTEVPEHDDVQLKLQEGSLEIDSSLYGTLIIPEVHPEVVSSNNAPVDPVVSLIQRGENDRRQNASTNITQGVSVSDQGPAEEATHPPFLQDEYTTILPDNREDVTPTPYDEEDVTSIPTEEDTTFLPVAKDNDKETKFFPADVDETTTFQTDLHDVTTSPFSQEDEAGIPLSSQGDHDIQGLIAHDVHANTIEFNKNQGTGYSHTNYHQESQMPEITYYETSQDQATDSFPQTPQEPMTYEQTPQEPVTFEQEIVRNQEPVTFEEGSVTFEQGPQEPVGFEQVPQEPVTFEQGPQEPVGFEQVPQEPVTFEQGPQEPVTFEQGPQEPVGFEQVPQEPVTFEQGLQGPVTFEQGPQEPVTFEQGPQGPVTFEQGPQEPVGFEQVPQEPVTFEQGPQEPVGFEQGPQEPVTFEQGPQGPVTFEQGPQEPVGFEQVPQEPVTFEQGPQEPVTFEQGPQGPVTFEQGPQEPVGFEQVPQEPVTFEQGPQEPVGFEQGPQEPVTFEQGPQGPVTFEQGPQEPVGFEQVPQEPVTFEQGPQEPVTFEQGPQEPITSEQLPQGSVTFGREPQNTVTFDQVPQEPVTFDQLPQEPVMYDQVPQEPVTFDQVPQEPVTHNQVPQEPVTFDQVPQEPVTFDQVLQEPVTYDQVPQEPVTFDQIPQEPVTHNQVPHEPVISEQVPEEPVTFDHVPQEPVTYDQEPQEPVTFDQVPQEPVTYDQEPQEPVIFDQGPQETVTFDEELQEPVTLEQGPQETFILEQGPQETVSFEQAPREPVTFEEIPKVPFTLDQTPQNHFSLDQHAQAPFSFEQTYPEPQTFPESQTFQQTSQDFPSAPPLLGLYLPPHA
ncbi:titin-like isoform X2 [Penaeus chinensis]|uniref:titin-like isoform X2 n=1 Tax=Penaeus chinensis TaxID=139456 RepID=UPI001FB5A3C0|nr:titin-like isoform X2 [Penaeus chinensis]